MSVNCVGVLFNKRIDYPNSFSNYAEEPLYFVE